MKSALSWVAIACAMAIAGCGSTKSNSPVETQNVSVSTITSRADVVSLRLDVYATALTDAQYATTDLPTSGPAPVQSGVMFQSDGEGRFSAQVFLAAGDYYFYVSAYNEAGQIIGRGRGQGSIQAAQVNSPASDTNIAINIFDWDNLLGTPEVPNAPDPGPVIVALQKQASVLIGDLPTDPATSPVVFTVTAINPEVGSGAGLTYQWSSNCASSSFSTPTAQTTRWTSTRVETCRITIFVGEANGNNTTASFNIDVLPPDGTGVAGISGTFVQQPVVTGFFLDPTAATEQTCYVDRSGTNATCLGPYAAAGDFAIVIGLDLGSELLNGLGASATLDARCSDVTGALIASSVVTGQASTAILPSSATFSWTAPNETAVCRLTARVDDIGGNDEMSVYVAVGAIAQTPGAPPGGGGDEEF